MMGDERVEALIAGGPEDPQALCDRLVDEVVERAGGAIKDDLALLAVQVA
jgi:serine phosphatase RsbU (regulator of sigma subunit)